MAIAPYGSWVSPIGIDALAEASNVVFAPRIDQGQLYWLLSQPSQGGRVGLWRQSLTGGHVEKLTGGHVEKLTGGHVEKLTGPAEELTPAVNVRTRVHEYGGGEYEVRDGIVCYVDFADGRIYRLDGGGKATAITPAGELRFADLRIHPDRGLVLAVREDHRGSGEAVNTVVGLDLDGPNEDGGRVLCSGRDFYSTPELSADGRLAWVEWDHPNMPWDSTAIMVGGLDDGAVADAQQVAGGDGRSAVQPRWLADGRLLFASDESGWWNPYLLDLHAGGVATAVCEAAAEFGQAQWQFGQQPYAILDDGALACTIIRAGEPQIVRVDLDGGAITQLTVAGVGAAGVVGDGRSCSTGTGPPS